MNTICSADPSTPYPKTAMHMVSLLLLNSDMMSSYTWYTSARTVKRGGCYIGTPYIHPPHIHPMCMLSEHHPAPPTSTNTTDEAYCLTCDVQVDAVRCDGVSNVFDQLSHSHSNTYFSVRIKRRGCYIGTPYIHPLVCTLCYSTANATRCMPTIHTMAIIATVSIVVICTPMPIAYHHGMPLNRGEHTRMCVCSLST